MMKRSSTVLFALAAAIAIVPLAAGAVVVTSKKSCAQAVVDAREAVTGASVSEKARAEAGELVRISEHLCGEANFVYAERLLGIARGMVAQE